jgi:hypothetical protein
VPDFHVTVIAQIDHLLHCFSVVAASTIVEEASPPVDVDKENSMLRLVRLPERRVAGVPEQTRPYPRGKGAHHRGYFVAQTEIAVSKASGLIGDKLPRLGFCSGRRAA